jgi:hypothetical protein
MRDSFSLRILPILCNLLVSPWYSFKPIEHFPFQQDPPTRLVGESEALLLSKRAKGGRRHISAERLSLIQLRRLGPGQYKRVPPQLCGTRINPSTKLDRIDKNPDSHSDYSHSLAVVWRGRIAAGKQSPLHSSCPTSPSLAPTGLS